MKSLEKLLQANAHTQVSKPELEFILGIPTISELPKQQNPLVRSELLITTIPHFLRPYLDEKEVSIYNNSIPSQEQLDKNGQVSHMIECLNETYPIKIEIGNLGNKKANDVRALIFFPDFIRVFDSKYEYEKFIEDLATRKVKLPINPLKKAELEFEKAKAGSLYSIGDMVRNQRLMSGTSSLLSPILDVPRISMSKDDRNHEITKKSSTQISIKRESIYHSESRRYINDEDFFIAPMCSGEGEIRISLISEELDQELIYTYPIKVV